MKTVSLKKGKVLFKSVSYSCESIFDYMEKDPSSKCKTNKMIWLSENEERARSYGDDIKYFTLVKELTLLDFVGEDCNYDFSSSLTYETIDSELRGKMSSILKLIGGNSKLLYQSQLLYSLLTGNNFSVGMQLETLKSILDTIKEDEKGDYEFEFDDETIRQMKVTPDGKTLRMVLDEYIEMGEELDSDQKKLKNQRLSIYIFDQILLKLICLNEGLDGVDNDIHGWYIPYNEEYNTVWKEIVNGEEVSDMSEIALFNASEKILVETDDGRKETNIIECDTEYRASLKKKRKKKSKRHKSKRHKSKRHKSKKSKSKKRKKK